MDREGRESARVHHPTRSIIAALGPAKKHGIVVRTLAGKRERKKTSN